MCSLAMEKEGEELMAQIQELRTSPEKVQSQQMEDSRSISKQQKAIERYLAKHQMLTTHKDECNRSIRDLRVLPEEAFEKCIKDKADRVRCWPAESLCADHLCSWSKNCIQSMKVSGSLHM